MPNTIFYSQENISLNVFITVLHKRDTNSKLTQSENFLSPPSALHHCPPSSSPISYSPVTITSSNLFPLFILFNGLDALLNGGLPFLEIARSAKTAFMSTDVSSCHLSLGRTIPLGLTSRSLIFCKCKDNVCGGGQSGLSLTLLTYNHCQKYWLLQITSSTDDRSLGM